MDNIFSIASGSVIWITGLSGAGKSSLATILVEKLRIKGNAVILLDGDQLREIFGAVTTNTRNHGRQARLALSMKYAHLCKILSEQGFIIVIATISLFEEIHKWNRINLSDYFEVYLKVPILELRRRDSKGLYRLYDEGKITDVAGLDLPIDEPKSAHYTIEFEPKKTIESLANDLMTFWLMRHKHE